jgi:hypothetical protein
VRARGQRGAARGDEAMTMRKEYEGLSDQQLVARFAEVGISQDQALLSMEISRFNKLFDEMVRIQEVLRTRAGDQRRLLLPLYSHSNMQVRLNAAKATWGVDQQAARAQLEAIAASKHNPQAGDAGMALWAIDEGISKLD